MEGFKKKMEKKDAEHDKTMASLTARHATEVQGEENKRRESQAETEKLRKQLSDQTEASSPREQASQLSSSGQHFRDLQEEVERLREENQSQTNRIENLLRERTQMTEELENLQVTGPEDDGNRPRWRNRRSQRQDKMEMLDLQSNLQSEIQAKQQVTNELSKVKQECVTLESKVQEKDAEIDRLKKEVEELREIICATSDSEQEK